MGLKPESGRTAKKGERVVSVGVDRVSLPFAMLAWQVFSIKEQARFEITYQGWPYDNADVKTVRSRRLCSED